MWSIGCSGHGRVVAAQHDVAGTDLCHQMTDCFGPEDQGIEVDLLEVFRGLRVSKDLPISPYLTAPPVMPEMKRSRNRL
jgi:hypothetical protein